MESHKWEKQAKVKKAPITSTVSTNLVRVHFISFIRLALFPLWNGSRTSECKHLYSYQYNRYHSVSKVFLIFLREFYNTLNIGKGSYDYLWPWYSLGKSQNTWEASVTNLELKESLFTKRDKPTPLGINFLWNWSDFSKFTSYLLCLFIVQKIVW